MILIHKSQKNRDSANESRWSNGREANGQDQDQGQDLDLAMH